MGRKTDMLHTTEKGVVKNINNLGQTGCNSSTLSSLFGYKDWESGTGFLVNCFRLLVQEDSSTGVIGRDFTCGSLSVTITDMDDDGDANAATAHAVGILSYSETDDFTTISVNDDET